ncbi:unnamed protein product [Rotaria sordida]|uniref:ubiquitinyl hydrolase 1 n=1 Tax=Rotaria sordida TaxID=392033 RepID=A0A814EJQ4_9BILA|nr:unnamed protein product [Rotaria sordida]CAF3621932.1 unnamed protein product [Rotaria sordida]
MGGGSTKIISYDDAAKRFFPADFERIETTFRDLTSGTGELSYTSFKRDVFAHFLPEKLAARLYQVCTSSSRSCMSLKDLICCLALIYYGTSKERMQLLYLLFAHSISNSNGILRWQDVEDFLSQCGDHPPEELDTIFQNHDEIVTQEKFLLWLESHQGHTTTITDWLMDDQRLHELLASPVDRISDQYSILAGVTHLSDIEVKDLEKTYYYLCTYSNINRQQQITLETFSNILTPVLPPILIPGFFDAFDENRDGCIDFKEFVCGISAACRGQRLERYKFLFCVFDRDHDGRLDRSDIVHMSSCLIDVAQFVYVLTIHMNDSPDIYADNILQKNDNNKNNQIDYFQQEDFINWCSTDSLIEELLALIFQICHVVLGLRPSTKQDEITIVKQFLRREQYPFFEAQPSVSSKTYHWINCNRSTSKPGSSWYLISMDWWLRWESSASLSSSTVNSTEPIGATIHKRNSFTKLNKLTNISDYKREPGDIDNSLLIDKNSTNNTRIINDDCVQLKLGLRRNIHFEMVPESLWLFLRKHYRCNGPAICRKVTNRKRINKPELDLYPLLIKIYRNQNLSPQQMQSIATNTTTNNNNSSHSMFFVYPLLNYVSASIFSSGSSSNSMSNNTQRHYLACLYFVSPYQTVRTLAEELSRKFGKSLDEIRIWIRYGENDLRQIDFESLDEIDCQSAGFEQNIDILLETRNNDLTWPEELYTLATRPKAIGLQSSSSSPSSNNNNSIGNVEEEGRGLIGLSNLGNTCFLNAAVQCLSHSFPLTFYFLHKYHLFEINKDNPIGMQGNIALRYGQLIAKLWSNVRGPLAPFELRDSVAKFGSSRFTDFQQHDSQEFLSFLLDGLHEDLNRVHNKPYVELKDSDNRPDEDVAYEHWDNHLARNRSIIVDLFHGLLRSQVKCRVCELKSVRFDPFNILSLPLPMDTSIYIEIKLIHLNGSRPTRYGIRLDGDVTINHLKTQLSTLSSLSIEQIGFFDIASSSCLRRNPLMDNDYTKIKQLNIRELLAYELPLIDKSSKISNDKILSTNPSLSYIKAMHRRLEPQERYLSPMTRHKIIFFGQPILIPYNSENKITNKYIYKIVFKQLERLLRNNNDSINTYNHVFNGDDSVQEGYPFILKHINEDGKKCSVCSWNRFCLGCSFEPNNKEFNYTSDTIAIEWEASAYYLRYLSNREQDVEIHSSVKLTRSLNNDSNADELSSIVRLEDCLESFIKWENLDHKEMFNCKTCRKLQPADKKLDIWKLPPCLIFHIKRFQLSNNRWIKSSRPVRFPIKSFHPSKYLGQRSSTNSLLQFHPTDDTICTSSSSSLSSITTTSDVISSSSIDNMLILSPSRLVNGNHNYLKQTNEQHKGLPPPEKINDTIKKKKKKRFGRRRKKLEVENSQSTLYPPRFSQMANRTLSFGDNSFDADNAAYNLYALICHYGVIGGGHYVAFIKNHTNQQWYCFNDSSCKPVSESILEQCSSSAYLLFYERESIDHRCYMPNVEGKKQLANEFPLTGDDRWCSLM